MRRLLPIVLLVAGLAAGPASPAIARANRISPSTRAARAMVRAAPAEVQRAVGTMRGPAVRALTRLLEDGVVPHELLRRLLDNPASAPVVGQVLVDLVRAQHVPGALVSIKALAGQKYDGRGYAFEVRVTALLAPYLASAGLRIRGREVDGQLRDGTTVEVKTGHVASTQAKMVRQAKSSTGGELPGLVIGAQRFEELGWIETLEAPAGSRRKPKRRVTRPWDLRHELARQTHHDVAAGFVSGDRIVIQVPSRTTDVGVYAGFGSGAADRPHTPHSKRAQKRVARQQRRR